MKNDAIPKEMKQRSGRFLKKAAQKLLSAWAGGRESSTAQI
jgi:hypothetical protein